MPTLYCPDCGYDLTGLMKDHCPECGCKFSTAELAAIGGIKHPPIVWPLTLLLISPVTFVVCSFAYFAMFEFLSRGRWPAVIAYTLIGMMSGCAFLGLGTSIFTGRRIARRLAMRPPKSRPNTSSVTLTLVFTCAFFGAQLCLGFFGFFVGCLVNLDSF